MSDENKNSVKFPSLKNPSLQHLTSRLIEYDQLLGRLEVRVEAITDGDNEKKKILANCRNYLGEARKSIEFSHQVILVWQLIHRLSEDTILLLTYDELVAEGEHLVHDIKMSSMSESIKTEWTKITEGKLAHLRELTEKDDDSIQTDTKIKSKVEKETVQIAESFRMIANLLNDHLDGAFWDIWFRRLLTVCYMISLLLGLFLLSPYYTDWIKNPATLLSSFLGIGLLGAVGGSASGVISGDHEFAQKGHFWLPLSYYVLVRPTFGALAAIIMFWMIQGGLFVTISPLLSSKEMGAASFQTPSIQIQSAHDVVPPKTPQTQLGMAPDPAGKGNAVGFAPENRSDSLIVFHARNENGSLYIYLLLLMFAGFSGDKLIRTVSDRAFARLFAQAEKTKESTKDK